MTKTRCLGITTLPNVQYIVRSQGLDGEVLGVGWGVDGWVWRCSKVALHIRETETEAWTKHRSVRIRTLSLALALSLYLSLSISLPLSLSLSLSLSLTLTHALTLCFS